jgi:hypothetical protein
MYLSEHDENKSYGISAQNQDTLINTYSLLFIILICLKTSSMTPTDAHSVAVSDGGAFPNGG